jgi:hypothetical protein
MGCMSASDAAPLPRLGEVFFDVRGESRTMRLSWYADTGVAVFSIWQGGTCTGTFRLPIPDLPRMVEALQRGPHAHDDVLTGEQPGSRDRHPPAVPAQRGPVGPDVTGYQAEPPLPGHLDPPGYTDEPPLPGHSDPPGYADEPPLAGHPEPPGYTDKPPLAGHRDPPGYADEPPLAGHPEDPQPYPNEPGAAYGDGPPRADGPGYPAGLAEPAEDFTAAYPAEPTPDFAAERGPRHSRPPTGRRSGGHRAPAETGYPEDLEPYPGEPGGAGLADEPADGYLGDDTLLAPGYPEDHQAGPDPLGAEPLDYGRPHRGRRGREPGYPAAQDDYQSYPEDDLPATDYEPPVRPYVTDTDDIGEPFADDPPERPKPRGRRRAGPAPDSFPYGPPPAGDEPRQRGRYPGRH